MTASGFAARTTFSPAEISRVLRSNVPTDAGVASCLARACSTPSSTVFPNASF
jgi:hypothetical protein